VSYYIPLDSKVALRSDCLSRHGAGRRDRIVRTSRSDYFDNVLLLTYWVVTTLALRLNCLKFYSMGTTFAWLVTKRSFPGLTLTNGQLIPGGEGPVAAAT
jgi:hypothetical protein